ncbi:hypothetical protein VN0806_13750 [Helicobacter pylori]
MRLFSLSDKTPGAREWVKNRDVFIVKIRVEMLFQMPLVALKMKSTTSIGV